MRPLFRLFAVGAGLAAVPAAAALPPQYQRLAELRAIIADPGVVGAFGGAPIDRIEYVRSDLYRVSGGGCRIEVAIVGLPTPGGMVGPRRFEVKAGRKACGREVHNGSDGGARRR
jgi:hypothetical protein